MNVLSKPTWGGASSMIAVSAALNTTETILVSAIIPANQMIAGTSYRATIIGSCTSTIGNTSNIRVRIGTAGTSADAVVAVVTPTAGITGVNVPFSVTLNVTIRTVGVAGTAAGNGFLLNNGITGISTAAVLVGTSTNAVVVNTTVQNTIQISYVSAAITTTTTFQIATIEIVKI